MPHDGWHGTWVSVHRKSCPSSRHAERDTGIPKAPTSVASTGSVHMLSPPPRWWFGGVGVSGEGIKRWGIEGIRIGISDRFGRGRGELEQGLGVYYKP